MGGVHSTRSCKTPIFLYGRFDGLTREARPDYGDVGPSLASLISSPTNQKLNVL